MERKHYYKNHEEIVSILTLQYRFKYHGMANNAEEHFSRGSDRPETIFIHPMFCHYYMDSSNSFNGPRLYNFDISTDKDEENQQRLVFKRLLLHLDEVSIKENIPLPKHNIEQYLLWLEEKRLELKRMAADTTISIESKKLIPQIYANVTSYHSLLSKTWELIK